MTREELAGWLELLAGEKRLDPGGLRAGSVAIVSPAQLVGTSFDRVMLAGIDAGAFPRTLPDDTVLSEPLRQQVNRRLGPRLMQRTPMEGRGEVSFHARDRWLWLEAFAAAAERVAVSFSVNPSSDNEGMSELVDDLGRALGLDPLQPGEPAYAAARPVAAGHALSVWAFGSLSEGARVGAVHAAGRAAALGEVLQKRYPERADGLLARLQADTAIASVGRRVAELDAPRRAWLCGWLTDRTHSPSRLDHVGTCAFAFFARVVLGLGREQIEVLGADPREQGNVAHAALACVYADIHACGGLASARRDPAAARQRARDTFEAAREQILAEAEVHPLLLDAVIAEAWRVVCVQLDVDLSAEDGFEPVAFELAFNDTPGADLPLLALTHPSGTASVRVRGSVDRVDRCGESIRVLDYKRTIKKRSPGRHFQLPLYAAAVAGAYDAREIEVGWAGFRDGKRTMQPSMSTEAVRESLQRDLWRRLDRLAEGDVSPDPVDSPCEWCDVRAVCRRDEARDGLREREAR